MASTGDLGKDRSPKTMTPVAPMQFSELVDIVDMLGKCRMLSERVVEVWLLSLLGESTASAADCEIFTHVRCMPRLRNFPEQCRAELNASAISLQEALPGAVGIGAYRSVRCAADDLIDKANACISTVKIRFEADEVAVAREKEVALLSAQGDQQRGITELLASLSSLLAARYQPTLPPVSFI